MDDVIESVARVALAGWIGESKHRWDAPPVLGMIGDELYLVEIDDRSRELVLRELIEKHQVTDAGLRIEIVLFGDAGGFFACSMNFFELWPKSLAGLPADVFVDNRYKAVFTKSGDEVVMSVRHAFRPGDGPPTRRFRFRPKQYEEAVSTLARESQRLRADLIAVARERAPEKVEALQEAFKRWPA
jgi:hypothetical protein